VKQEISVTAHRAVTEYDKDQNLISTLELRVPADELEFMGEVLEAMRDDKDVTSTLVVRTVDDGTPRRLALKLKASKMKDFVPVAVFTKYGNAHDNLTELFSTGRYGRFELTLIVEIIEDKDDQDALDFEAARVAPAVEEPEHVAQERMLGEGCPHCPDAPDRRQLEAEHYLSTLGYDQTCDLLASSGIDPTDWDDPVQSQEQDLAEMRAQLLLVCLPEVLAEMKGKVAAG
jgi:hypothetical protein